MPKLEAVATPMQLNNNIEFVYKHSSNLEDMQHMPVLEPFADDVLLYANHLSKALMQHPETRQYPDVATFAFFCRTANLQKWKNRYAHETKIQLGRGLVFHIAPSNVAVNFAYSMICGLLAGNNNIIRVPSAPFDQIRIIAEAMESICTIEEIHTIYKRIVLLRYDKHSNVTQQVSAFCDVRVIWGGDETIAQIRKNAIPARAYDITFADRYSLCIIHADAYVQAEDKNKIATGFYNDTYLFDQNACTAPHLLIWTGNKEQIQKAKELFWNELYQVVVQKEYKVQAVVAVDKLTTLYSKAIEDAHIHQTHTKDNLIWRVELERLQNHIDSFRCNSGFFSEYSAASIDDIAPITNRKFQTLAYYGFEKEALIQFVKNNSLQGIDRIVPIGQTADFSIIWDGYDLIQMLSRYCDIQ